MAVFFVAYKLVKTEINLCNCIEYILFGEIDNKKMPICHFLFNGIFFEN